MSDILLSAATRLSLLSLTDISTQMLQAQTRLATGKRVNSAFDDPVAFFTASNLNARAAALNTLSDGITNAQQTLDAANNGIDAIQSLLNSAESVANLALQSPDTLVEITGNNTTSLTTATSIESAGGSTTKFKAGDQVTVSDGTTTATYTAANGDTVQTFLNAINNTANLKVDASLNASGQIVLQATDSVDVTVGATLGGSGTLNSVLGLNTGTTNFEINTTRQSYAQQFDSLLDQIDQAAQDAGYNGTDLLTGGSLTVPFNETGTSSLALTGSDFTSSGLGVADSVGTFQVDSNINAAVDAVKSAISTVQTQSQVFSSNSGIISAREDFTKALTNTLTTGADQLVGGDVSSDSATLLALQTRQQMIGTVLSLTQSESQTALRMLGG